MQSNEQLKNEIRKLTRRLNAANFIFGMIICAMFFVFCGVRLHADSEIDHSSADKIIRTRGIVVVDDQGRDRILIGAPIPASQNRIFSHQNRAQEAWKDRIPLSYKPYWDNYKNLKTDGNGMIVLDENGFDRLLVGENMPDPNTGKRIGAPTGIFLNDERGFERGGFNVMNVNGNDRIVLGLDARSGEAASLSVIDNAGMGLRINDPANKVFIGNLPPKIWENKSDSSFSGYIFQQNGAVKQQYNSTTK